MSRRNPEGRMRLIEHFKEFRFRLLLIVGGIAVGMIGGWFLADWVFQQLQAPIDALADQGMLAGLNFAQATSGLDMRIRISLLLSLVLTSPWWLYQLGAFIGPGLKRSEKKYVALFMLAGAPLFALGAFAGWILLPHAVTILLGFIPDGGSGLQDARTYLTFSVRLILAFAIAFLFPLVLVLLNLIGVVSSKTLLGGWRWAVLIMFTFGAVANPLPDPVTMIVIGLTLTSMYFAAVGVTALIDRGRAKRAARLDAS